MVPTGVMHTLYISNLRPAAVYGDHFCSLVTILIQPDLRDLYCLIQEVLPVKVRLHGSTAFPWCGAVCWEREVIAEWHFWMRFWLTAIVPPVAAVVTLQIAH